MNLGDKKEPAHKLATVKTFESSLGDEDIKIRLYRKGQRYGVVTLYKDAAVARDYSQSPEAEVLRTFLGNEESIIEWVAVELANQRYAELVMATLSPHKKSILTPGKPALSLVPARS